MARRVRSVTIGDHPDPGPLHLGVACPPAFGRRRAVRAAVQRVVDGVVGVTAAITYGYPDLDIYYWRSSAAFWDGGQDDEAVAGAVLAAVRQALAPPAPPVEDDTDVR